MVRNQIKNLIKKVSAVTEAIADKKIDFTVEIPEERTHGDYATNIALIMGRKQKKDPMKIAESLVAKFKIQDSKFLDKVEIIEPGFINFFLKPKFLQKQIEEILKQGEDFGKINIGKNKKIQVEFISANPTGLLHLGHGRGAFFGDVLSNVLTKAGYKIEREYYINDAKKSTQIQELGRTALGKGKTYLTPYLKSKTQNLKPELRRVKNEGEVGYKLAKEIHKDIKSFIEKKLKIRFDKWFSEESLYKSGEIDKIYQWLKKKNLIYKKEGAEWLKTSKYGDEKDWVIIRATNEPTYLLSDIAYHKNKFTRGYDGVINIWGADHQGHVKKMKAVAKILAYGGNLELLITQMVRLKEGGKGLKMSKRAGTTVELEWLIDEVGLDVARFLFLMKSINTQMEFDLNLAKEKSEKNPVYYIQYAHARICSILKKISKYEIQNTEYKLLTHPSELELTKELIKLPEIIEDTAKDYQIQRLPNYAIELATAFHRFYANCRVLKVGKNLEKARLSLILATKIVLENVLNLMGVSTPERM